MEQLLTLIAELEQPPRVCAVPPDRILARHGSSQTLDPRTEAWSADPRAGFPAPERLPGLPVPADQRLRPHEDQGTPPVRAEATGEVRQQLVAGTGRGALPSRAREDRRLVAQERI